MKPAGIRIPSQTQRRFRPVVQRVGVRPPAQQQRQSEGAAVKSGVMQRRPAGIVRRVHIRPGVQIACQPGRVAVPRRPVKIQAAKRRRHRHIHRHRQLANRRGSRNPGASAAPPGQPPAKVRKRRESHRRPVRNRLALQNFRVPLARGAQGSAARNGKQRPPLLRSGRRAGRPVARTGKAPGAQARRAGTVRIHLLVLRAFRPPVAAFRRQQGENRPTAAAVGMKPAGVRIPSQAQRRFHLVVQRVHIRPRPAQQQRHGAQMAVKGGVVQRRGAEY